MNEILISIFNPENEIGCHFNDCISPFTTCSFFFVHEETCEIRCKENLDLWLRLVANGFFSEILNLFCTLFAREILHHIAASIEERISIRFVEPIISRGYKNPHFADIRASR